MSLRTTAYYDLWTLDAASEYTTMIYSWDFRNAIFTIIADNSANATIKFYGSNSETRPSLASAASSTNEYSPTQVIDLDDHSAINWDTWVSFNWSQDWVTRYEINENWNKWLWVKMTARSAWDVTIRVDLADNQ